MITNWEGVNNRSTPLTKHLYLADYAQNVRYKVNGELQRRYGMLPTSIAQVAGRPRAFVAMSWRGNIVTFIDYEDSMGQIVIDGQGPIDPPPFPPLPPFPPPFPPLPPPPWPPPQPPKEDGQCVPWDVPGQNGSSDDTITFTLPERSCPGVLTMNGYEFGGGGRGDDYGWTFVVDADGVNIHASGCLVNDSSFVNIPGGTTTVTVGITGGCAFGSTPGTWSCQLDPA